MPDALFDLPAPEPPRDLSGTGARKTLAMLKVMEDEDEAARVSHSPAGRPAVKWVVT